MVLNNIENKSFKDTQLEIKDLDVSNFINLLDQYVSDRDWIKQALIRLKLELKEEIDLNNKLKELQPDETSFLVNKVQDFIKQYEIELVNTENELQQILTELQKIIIENQNLMNSNKILKEQLIQLNNNGIDNKIINIRNLINSNIKLLKDNNRWGDTTDQYFKFNNNTNLSTLNNNSIINTSNIQHNETQGHYSALYLDGNTWFYLKDLDNKNLFPLEDNKRTLCFWAKQNIEHIISEDVGIFGWGTIEPEPGNGILPFTSFGARCLSNGKVYMNIGAGNAHADKMPLQGTGWHHYCWVFDQQGIQYYYDGNSVGRQDIRWSHNKQTKTLNTKSGIYLGCNVGENNDSKYNGYISEIAIYNTNISEQQIQAIYNAPSQLKDLLQIDNTNGFSKMVYYNRLIKTLDGTNTGLNNIITNSNPIQLQTGIYETVSTDLINH